jgi:hypothetical protein
MVMQLHSSQRFDVPSWISQYMRVCTVHMQVRTVHIRVCEESARLRVCSRLACVDRRYDQDCISYS